MDTSGDTPRIPAEGSKPAERKAAPRPRPEPGHSAAGSPPRAAPDGRRKRPAEGRYTGWGDGLDRVACARAERILPTSFPVASHPGAATIAMAIVARRPDALLLCGFSHCGAHVWPDGEIVEDARAAEAPAPKISPITVDAEP